MLLRQNGSGSRPWLRFFMIILIAESKTMNLNPHSVTEDEFFKHTPHFEREAEEIVNYLDSLDMSEFKNKLSLSDSLAIKARKLFYDFSFKNEGWSSLYAFTGDVYRALDINSLSQNAIDYLNKNLFIVSSLYGVLNTQDIIKPYRLDFTAEASPGGGKLVNFWKQKLSIWIVKYIKEASGQREILNLLPADASNLFDWKIIKAFAKVYKVDFKKIEGDGYKTPSAGKLKALRGEMVRIIAENNISSLNLLSSINSENFSYSKETSRTDYPSFVITE